MTKPKKVTFDNGSTMALPEDWQIPSSFQLAGIKFKVEKVDGEIDNGCAGKCWYDRALVKVSTYDRNGNIPWDTQGRVFCHELVHLILDALGENELSENEKLVSGIGMLFHQFLQTQK